MLRHFYTTKFTSGQGYSRPEKSVKGKRRINELLTNILQSKMSSNCITDTSKLCFNKCCVNSLRGPNPPSTSSPKSDPRREFKTAILSTIELNTSFTNHESLPSLTQLFSRLISAFPQYLGTVLADDIRTREYNHLSSSNRVCLDYIGNGLFSHSQLSQSWNPGAEFASLSSSSSSAVQGPFFSISYMSPANGDSGSLFGSQEPSYEAAMRNRIIKYMNLFEEDYSLVFMANQSSALKLLADSYPFKSNRNILTVYDYESDSIQAMVGAAVKNGARPQSASLAWPNFRVCFRKLRKLLVNSNKQKHRGLFVFPLQSRVTGSRYSHQWMNLARDSGWHVLLDASALGAKDMETLGLSLFQPDFIISSFFKIFGLNPSGFCCLFIKKSSLSNLNISSTSIGAISLKPEKGPFSKSTLPETNSQKASTSKSQYTNEDIQDDTGHQKPSSSISQLKDDESLAERNYQTPSSSSSQLDDDKVLDEAKEQTPSSSSPQLKTDEILNEENHQTTSGSSSQLETDEILNEAKHQTPSGSSSQLQNEEILDEAKHQTPSGSSSQLQNEEILDEVKDQTPSGSSSQLETDDILDEAKHQTPSGSSSQLTNEEILDEAKHQTSSASSSQLQNEEILDEANHQTPSGSSSQLKHDEVLVEAKQQTPSGPNPQFKNDDIVEVDQHPWATQFRNKLKPNSKPTQFECEGLNHADTLGLILISTRTRILTNWLVNALLSLKHPNSATGLALVKIYGPKIKLDRGPAVAFNVYDWKGEKVDPILVQKLADRNNISVSCGFLTNVWFSKELQAEKEEVMESRRSVDCSETKKKGKGESGIEVVSIYVGMLNNFEDMVRVWKFVARFLDADFVEKERWRYTALNQIAVVEV